MAVLPTTELGHGPDIVLLHGVGVGAPTFAELAAALAVDHRVVVVERPGDGTQAVALDAQAAAVADTIVALGATGAQVVGVSGGATLALLVGLRHPGVVGSLVVHEPLVGQHAAHLHDRFQDAARRAGESHREAVGVVQAVVGNATWARLGPDGRAQVEAAAAWVQVEVPLFAAFDPTLAELSGLRAIPMLTTVGSRSEPDRHDAARALERLAGARIAVIPGAGNAVQLDSPRAFAAAIRSWVPAPVGCGS